ncbi:MAG: ABC transporter ATP-binding protein [Candidatus Saganbacteria bacterium]|nr:ABC transporter ATP-binding protein [Candidatus Saganbacteria bacterium]
MPSIVTARNLVKKFGDFTAVDGISFEIRTGECFGFLGPNGAGKTTTIRMIHCVSPRSGGELTVLGRPASVDNREIKRLIGVVPQEINLDADLTVRENLSLYAEFYDLKRRPAAARIAELLDFVELKGKINNQIAELSTGMKRRLQIARALVNQPQLIIADEPTTGLDPQARRLIWQRLRELKGRGATIILTTQYMEEAEQLCDRLVVMSRGKIIDFGSPDELKKKHDRPNLEEVYLKLTGHGLQEEAAE